MNEPLKQLENHPQYFRAQADCFDILPVIPSGSVDLILTDPPYNIGVHTVKDGKSTVNEWDKIENYIEWSIKWLNECARILKPTGVLYFFHNDMAQIAELLHEIHIRTPLVFVSFCIWDKGKTFRPQSWKDRQKGLRCWFNICEYCLHFFNTKSESDKIFWKTDLDRILTDPSMFNSLKQWYKEEMTYLGLSKKDLAQKYGEYRGRKPCIPRHYFSDSGLQIPTKKVYEAVYKPLGFRREYEDLRREYEELRREYEDLRNFHRQDPMHCNVWHIPPIPSTGRFHTCQKPVKLLERLIRVSCPEGGTVLDPFMGSGSTGVACINLGRKFIGIEKDVHFFEVADKRIQAAIDNYQHKLPFFDD